MRKVALVVLAAVLAVVALPALPAGASPSDGSFHGCFTIDKPGNYNQVYAGATVTSIGTSVRVNGFVAVTRSCQRADSTPIRRITILHARLEDARNGRVVRLSDGNTTYSKSIVRSTTASKYAACGHGYQASIEVSYAYSDGSFVHPFWIHGHTFTRC